MTDGDKKRGFSGLDRLLSDVESSTGAERNRKQQASSGTRPHGAAERPQGESKSTPASGVSRPIFPPSDEKAGGTGKIWLGIAGFVIFVVWIANQDSSRQGSSASDSSSSYSAPSKRDPQETSNLPSLAVPPIGTNHIHSTAEIRYCIATDIRIEALRPHMNSNEQIDVFNGIVSDYNSRCGSYRYRQGALVRAKGDIEPYRSVIAANAWNGLSLSSSDNNAQQPPRVQRSQLTMEIQMALSVLGYQPGTADGIYGPRTKSAVQAFQRDMGVPQNGLVSRQLLERLKAEMAQRKSRRTSVEQRVPTHAPVDDLQATAQNSHFTRGSPQKDVLRLQGVPSEIDTYSKVEIWWYGFSSVEVDRRTKRVVAWDNNGNLRVKLLPGGRATSAGAFTRGSHQDDVLRLEGTPSEIDTYSNHEIWWYGFSSVKIDKQSKRVIEWDNNGNLKLELPPGSNSTFARAFTRGSHQDDVLRLQGTPSEIDTYSNHEIWWYGFSSVKINAQSKRVIQWDNNGNLKVELSPGSNTTSARAFTQGSHQDDVLRIQGTPSEIDTYSNHEVWWYGFSSVKIDKQSKRVIEWDNNGNLIVRL